jgi:hypothetical protein
MYRSEIIFKKLDLYYQFKGFFRDLNLKTNDRSHQHKEQTGVYR